MTASILKIAATAALAVALTAPAFADERATKAADVTGFSGGILLVDQDSKQVTRQLSPTGKHEIVPAKKRETIQIGVYTSNELDPKAKASITRRDPITRIGMTTDGILDSGAPVSAAKGTVETVDPTNLITLKSEDDGKATFGSTVKKGDLYYANNGQVYQYLGTQ